MHMAVQRGNIELAQTLLSVATSGRQPAIGVADAAKSLVNAKIKRRMTPLSLALLGRDNTLIAKLLVMHGAIPTTRIKALLSIETKMHDNEFS